VLLSLLCVVFAQGAALLGNDPSSWSPFPLGTTATDTSTEHHSQLFEDFVTKFKKTYLNDKEKASRFQIFRDNLGHIERLNRQELGTARYGITEFTDLTAEEFDRDHAVPYDEDELARTEPTRTIVDGDELDGTATDYVEHEEVDLIHDGDTMGLKAKLSNVRNIPRNHDWRDYGAVSHVKNQGSCGSCWAFAALGSLEGALALHGFPLVSLSEQNLVNCDKSERGCKGGIPAKAFEFIARTKYVELEDRIPYDAKEHKCRGPTRHAQRLTSVTNWVSLSGNEATMAAYLYRHGPLAGALHARGWLHYYHGGIAQPRDCPSRLTHGITIVGYGEDNGHKFWTIKNSWGPLFGEEGFFRLKRGANTCNISRMAIAPYITEPRIPLRSVNGKTVWFG